MNRKSPCRVCHYLKFNHPGIILGRARKGASDGCIVCKLVLVSAELFGGRWIHLKGEEDENVSMIIGKNWHGSGLVQTTLKWRSVTGQPEYLAIQIMTEEEYTDVWPFFAKAPVSLNCRTSEYLQFIESRLADCDKNHEDCKQFKAQATRPKRILRINDSNPGYGLILVLEDTIDISYKYVALSHCWGTDENAADKQTAVPKTTKENLYAYQSCGLSVSGLTRTFQHAIDLTKRLGIEYIWIDSLCIVQDDSEDKTQEFPKMGDIYGGAHLVIAATLAKNGGYGLHHQRRLRRTEFLTAKSETFKIAVREKIEHDVWKKGDQLWIAPELPLLDRAWAFQERMLATRVVHFTPHELVWECRSSVDCECGDLQDPWTRAAEFGVGKNLKTKYGEVVRWGCDLDRLKFWHNICAQYSARKLTYASDRLPALSSIAKEIDMPGVLGHYLAGIWMCTLPLGLLWWSEYTNSHLYSENIKTHRRNTGCNIPSWSWLSIDGRVSTWGRSCQSLARIEHIGYATMQEDKYGSCTEGEISVSGRVVPVEVTSATRKDGPSKKEIRLTNIEDTFDFIADTNPFEISDEDLEASTILALRFATAKFPFVCTIILRLLTGSNERYERLGIAECPDEWFVGCTPITVTLV